MASSLHQALCHQPYACFAGSELFVRRCPAAGSQDAQASRSALQFSSLARRRASSNQTDGFHALARGWCDGDWVAGRCQSHSAAAIAAAAEQDISGITASPLLVSFLRDGFVLIPLPGHDTGGDRPRSVTPAPTDRDLKDALSLLLGSGDLTDSPLVQSSDWLPLVPPLPTDGTPPATPPHSPTLPPHADPATLLSCQLLSTRDTATWQAAAFSSVPTTPSASQVLTSSSSIVMIVVQEEPGPSTRIERQNKGDSKAVLGCHPVWVFPRSHWAVSDWLQACLDSASENAEAVGLAFPLVASQAQEPPMASHPLLPLLDAQTLPPPVRLPHAPPQLVPLTAGHILVLHPWTLLHTQGLAGTLDAPSAVSGPMRMSRVGLVRGGGSRSDVSGVLDPLHAMAGDEGEAVQVMWQGWPILSARLGQLGQHCVESTGVMGVSGANAGQGSGSSTGGRVPVGAPEQQQLHQQHAAAAAGVRVGVSLVWPPVLLEASQLQALQEEAERAQLGNWAAPSSSAALCLPGTQALEGPGQTQGDAVSTGAPWHFTLRHIWAKDLVSWFLRCSIQTHLQAGQWQEALPLLLSAAPLAPKDPVVALLAGYCLLQTVPKGQIAGRAGRKCWLEDAERFLVRASDLEPSWVLPACLLVRALVLMGRGRELEAESVMQKVMKGHPELCCASWTEEAVTLPLVQADQCSGSLRVPVFAGRSSPECSGETLPANRVGAGLSSILVDQLLQEALVSSQMRNSN